jgi:ergothioneine biosynthesis protein EgtB
MTQTDPAMELAELDAASLAKRYRAVRAASLALSDPLSAEDCALQSMPDASPTKWHLAHTSWYFETFVLAAAPDYRAFDPAFAFLFNSYYNSVGEQYSRPHRGLLSRPTLETVHAYREHVDTHMLALLEEDGLDVAAREVALLGTHHEQQHQELILTDLKHLFGENPTGPVYRESAARPVERRRGAEPATFAAFPGGLHELGHAGAGFAFDNEGPRHRIHLEPFALARRPVTNREYLAFLEDGAYRDPTHWLSDGWAAVQTRSWQAPLYWRRRDGGWETLTLGGVRALDLDTPVTHVSYYEADAYARWAGARLPTEAEWEVAAADVPLSGNFVESGALHPLPDPADAGRLRQLFGDVWEWTASAYAPYPGFRAPEGALGEYNGKFMSGQMVLRGGSCASPADHLRRSYRNFFPPDARWQFSGIRLARDAAS